MAHRGLGRDPHLLDESCVVARNESGHLSDFGRRTSDGREGDASWRMRGCCSSSRRATRLAMQARLGYPEGRMEAGITVKDVRTFDTKGGNTRYVVTDSDGNEYTTFREAIGKAALSAEGSRARIEYH